MSLPVEPSVPSRANGFKELDSGSSLLRWEEAKSEWILHKINQNHIEKNHYSCKRVPHRHGRAFPTNLSKMLTFNCRNNTPICHNNDKNQIQQNKSRPPLTNL